MLTTFVVTNSGDVNQDGNTLFGSLRWAVESANAMDDSDTIIFSEAVFVNGGPTTINLTGSMSVEPTLSITQPLRIIGPSAREVTIQQSRGNRRVFIVNDGMDDETIPVEISGVTLTGGNITGTGDDKVGGAILNSESLRMVEAVVQGNSASQAGGGIQVLRGSLNLERCLIADNSAGFGGGIAIGSFGDSGSDDVLPFASIRNSTISGNTAGAAPTDEIPYAPYGGGIFVSRGNVNITGCTISENSVASGAMNGYGDGVAVMGNAVMVDDMGMSMPTEDRGETTITSSILFGNGDPMAMLPPTDLASVGVSMGDMDMLVANEPNITSGGFNDIGTVGGPMMVMVPTSPMDLALGTDPMLMPLDNYGGAMDVYMLDPMSPAIDSGMGGTSSTDFDGRGRHFLRSYNYTNKAAAQADIGAVERQSANFIVDQILDEQDSQTSRIYATEIFAGQPNYLVPGDPYGTGGSIDTNFQGQLVYRTGDFSLREALEYSSLNPDQDVISFNLGLTRAEGASSVANPPTIRLTLGPLSISESVIINGPREFILEIDASGNDPTPTVNNGDGSRVLQVFGAGSHVEIKNLTIMGADVVGRGGGVQSFGDLLMSGITFKDNYATDDAGAFLASSGKIRIENSTFKQNTAGDDGGALVVDGATADVTVLNSTFSGNVAGDRGGAIVDQNGKLAIQHSTITLNTAASTRGSGVWVASATTMTTIFSSIISGNGSNNDVEFAAGVNPTNITSEGFNLVGGGNASPATPASGRFTATGDKPRIFNPMLAPLQNTGGLIETHRPITGSPVIDMGPQGVVAPFVITPTAVTSNKPGSPAKLIDNSGLSGPVTVDTLTTVTHSLLPADGWTTPLPAPMMAAANLTFTLPGLSALQGMVLWGVNGQGTDGDDPMDLTVEISNDGGMSFLPVGEFTFQRRQGAPVNIGFGNTFYADTVRITILSNFEDDPNIGGGGMNIALGEVKFTSAYDERGFDFTRVYDGNLDGTARMDIGAYELQGSVFYVSTMADENDGNVTVNNFSLREAIQLANDNPLPDEIRFDDRVFGFGGSISLGGTFAPNTTADMKITAPVKITGPGSELLTISLGNLRDNSSQQGRRALTVDDLNASNVIDVEISGITFTNALAEQSGGVMFSHENLTLRDVTFINNTTVGDGFHGGGIFIEKPVGAPAGQDIVLTLDASRITGNHTDGVNSDGGAIYAKDVAVYITNYTSVSGNSTAKTGSDGGGIFLKSTVVAAPANFDFDEDVDGFDFLTWQRGNGLSVAGKVDGDATGDGTVSALDLSPWKSSFGAVGNQGAILRVTGSSITGNLTGAGASDGGGVFSDAGQIVLTDAVISGNITTGSNSEGGGIHAVNSQISVVRSVISLNETFGSQSPGAGIYALKTANGTSSITIDDSILSQNVTHGQSSSGGGVAHQEASVIIRDSTVDGNRVTGSSSHGGGVANLNGTLSVVSSTFSNNQASHATGKGGGIYSDTNLLGTHSTLVLNSTVSGNTAALRGGGVFNADGLTEIKHSTITNNATPFFNVGSGVASQGNTQTRTKITSSIVAGNQGVAAGTQTDVDFVDGSFTNSIQSGGYNLLGTGNALGAFSVALGDKFIGQGSPLLGPLQDNSGGLPAGRFQYPLTHELLPGSPAKNLGNPAFNPNAFSPALIYDQRGAGFPRVAAGRIDIGAFESPVIPFEAALVAADEPAAASALMIDAAPAQDAAPAPAPSLASTAGLPALGVSRMSGSTRRPAQRAEFQREPQSVVWRPRSVAFDAWSTSAVDDLALAHAACNGGRYGDAEDGDLSAEDAVFALLADGLEL